MKISVITAVWNGAKTIETALDSVRRQQTALGGVANVEIEHIVVDGGSTDGTVERVKEFGAQATRNGERGISADGYSFRWISEKDRGLYDAINKGIRMATGDVVGICNADDVLDGDDVLVRIARAFEEGAASRRTAPGRPLDCVYGKIRFVDELGGRTVRRCFAKLWRPWMLQWGYMPPHPGVFIRRECFEKWGYYVPDRKEYKIAADYELLIRFFRVHKMRAFYSGICTTVMRTGGVSTRDMNARKILNGEIVKANRANGYFCCWPMLMPKYAVKAWEVILPRLGFDGR